MPFQVTFTQTPENTRHQYGLRVQAYFGTDLYVKDNMTFDQAEVRGGLHVSPSEADRDPTPHLTIRLTNQQLRDRGDHHLLHWRANGNHFLFPDSANQRRAQKEISKAKRAKEYEARREDHNKRGGRGGGGGSSNPVVAGSGRQQSGRR